MGGLSMMVALLLLLCSWGVLNAIDRPSIWDIDVENQKKGLLMKNKGRFGGGQDAESNVVGGDILVDPSEPNPAQMRTGVQKTGRIANADMMAVPLFSWHQKLWMSREIPYVITSSANKDRSVILEGIQGIRGKMGGCLKFRPKYSSDKWWLEFFYGIGCFSGIGRKYWKTGATKISIGDNCNYKDIVMHEILHALGFPHEQSRRDRDWYVKIYSRNIRRGFEANFAKSRLTDSFYFGTPYDYRSIMHYGKTAFSNGGGRPTIEKLNDPRYKLGGGELSYYDAVELKSMYGCAKRDGWSDWIDTPCMCSSDKKFCTISKVRICFGRRECRSTKRQQYGTQYQSKKCRARDEGKGGQTTFKPVISGCKDDGRYAKQCGSWASTGECVRNAAWMTKYCCLSCRPTCNDNGKYAKLCVTWSKQGECQKNRSWMKTNCCRSCSKSK